MPLRRVFLALLLVLSAAWPARAQSPDTSGLAVVVTDQSGARIPGASIIVSNAMTGLRRETVSGARGTASIAALPLVGEYSVTVSKTGFTDSTAEHLVIRAGETATVRLRLTAAGGESAVTVYGTTDGLRRDPQISRRLDAAEIEETPVLGRKITSLPMLNAAFRSAKGTGDLFINSTFFVTGAGGRRQPSFTLDGATNDDAWGRQTMLATLPVTAVQEMSVLSNAFSAEFGWTSGPAVNLVSKSGTNTTHGSALFLGRPGGLQSKDIGTSAWCPASVPTCTPPTGAGGVEALTPADIPDELAQVSGTYGTALVRDQTFLFATFDYSHQNRTAPITSPFSPVTEIVGNYRQFLVDARLDHRLSSSNRLMVRANLDRFYDTNPQDAVANNVLPNAGRKFIRHTWSAQVNDTAVLSSSVLNEARLVFLDGDPITNFEPVQPATRFSRSGVAPFTAGESRRVKAYSRMWQLSDTLTWSRGAHDVRFGGSIARSVSGGDGTEFGSAYTLGSFTVKSSTTAAPEDLTLADMQRYQQSFNYGKSDYELTQWLVAGFVQDSIHARPDLTVDLGVRYDVQSFSDSRNNIAPRVGFGWNPGGDPRTVVRGGYGLYYTQLVGNLAADFELGGPEGVFTYTAVPGETGFPTCITCTPVAFNSQSATLPARDITIRPGMAGYYGQFFDISKLTDYPDKLVNSKSQVASIGVSRELTPGLVIQADYVHQHWSDIVRGVDLNRPSYFERTEPGQVRSSAAADLTRPILPVDNGFRSIEVIQNLGVADYDGLETQVTYRGHGAYAAVSYTLSKATNTTEPDGHGANPNDENRLGETERGPSILDQRHRAVITFTYALPAQITAGTVTQLASARPFNATTGVDNNGDGHNRGNDRPVINGQVIGKSAFRGTPISDVSVFVEKNIGLASHGLVLRAEVFNVFNHANVLGREETYGNGATPNANFGRARAGLAYGDSGRMVQFLLRYQF